MFKIVINREDIWKNSRKLLKKAHMPVGYVWRKDQLYMLITKISCRTWTKSYISNSNSKNQSISLLPATVKELLVTFIKGVWSGGLTFSMSVRKKNRWNAKSAWLKYFTTESIYNILTVSGKIFKKSIRVISFALDLYFLQLLCLSDFKLLRAVYL
jgi:hypothetical protein